MKEETMKEKEDKAKADDEVSATANTHEEASEQVKADEEAATKAEAKLEPRPELS